MGDLGFWALAQENPDYLALVTPEGDEMKAGELLGRANQLVHALRAQGFEVGDRIATLLPNGAEMIEIYLAALQAGWYLVPINFHLVAPEVAYILKDSGAKAFVAHERFADVAVAAADEAGTEASGRLAVGAIDGFTSYAAARDAQPTTLPEDRTVGDVMNYTSGTTGNPKGIYRKLMGVTPEEAALGLAGLLFLFNIQPQDDNVHIIGSPLYHTAVLRFGSASLHLGHTLVIMDKWIPEDMLRLIEERRVTTSHMVPTQFHRLLALPEDVRGNYDMSSLRHMIHAAAPCPIDVKHKMIAWWGNAVDEYYAASEGGGTLVTAEEWLQKPGTVGKPWPISEIAIFDDEGNRIEEPNVIGTVYMSMGTASFEYHKDQEKTKKNRIGSFFTVGDVGLIDEDGFLFLRDRKIDMIISGGANIYPAEIESVLLSHPKVGDAAVFGIPNEDWGEEVKAVIEPAEGIEADDELAAEILAFCGDKLAKFKTPKTVDFTTEMPRDPNGKLYKRKLRDPYWEGMQRAL
ncbi:MAG TPA: acyl-CoA synthetase [Acidimicrobiales bacterium]|jgi:long-chain acyl-CoA synthetase|nr:acyl-CoA synthetase [Acidimicrobiales bacterium]